mmetsp:Transcript_16263/g.42135  ORF Transcript_16263/g.42135 Transcript_16263/m.42135 type:complete len:251 (-) Transcript_16263:58-810(-)
MASGWRTGSCMLVLRCAPAEAVAASARRSMSWCFRSRCIGTAPCEAAACLRASTRARLTLRRRAAQTVCVRCGRTSRMLGSTRTRAAHPPSSPCCCTASGCARRTRTGGRTRASEVLEYAWPQAPAQLPWRQHWLCSVCGGAAACAEQHGATWGASRPRPRGGNGPQRAPGQPSFGRESGSVEPWRAEGLLCRRQLGVRAWSDATSCAEHVMCAVAKMTKSACPHHACQSASLATCSASEHQSSDHLSNS